MLLFALCVQTAGAERHFILSYRTRASKLFGDPRTPMQVSYPQVGQERQFKTEEYYLVTFELPKVLYPEVPQERQFKTEVTI